VAAPASGELFPFNAPGTPEEKPVLNILPPAESKRVAQSWENRPEPSGAPAFEPRARRDERPSFRPERRDAHPEGEGRDSRPPGRDQKFDPREPRRDFRPEARTPHAPDSAVEQPRKSGGFIGWLKGLFGSKPAAGEPGQPAGVRDESGRDGQRHHRRRHRGGRGRGGFQGDNRGPRDGQAQQPRSEGGQPRHEGEGRGDRPQGDGFRRRRHRGGRGRHQGGGYGGDPRPEGTQGGGAI
jgi:hypothetical protein